MTDAAVVVHEGRLTRLEDRLDFPIVGLVARLDAAVAGLDQIAALAGQIADLSARVTALEAGQQPQTAGSIGLSPE